MKQLVFTTEINAPRDRVWRVLWDEKTYAKWTSVFSEGSYAVTEPEGEYKKGNKIKFMSPDGNGLFSLIDQCKPPEVMSFRHLGVIKNGEVQLEDEETKKWSGAMESYYLSDKDGETILKVELDSTSEFADYFSTKFPQAIEAVKELAEK